MSLPSHAGNGAVKSYWRWRYHGGLAVMRCRCRVILATVLSSHAGDSAAGMTCPRRDIDVES
jgi:hypothetical protein